MAYKKSREELEEDLKAQLNFLKRSAAAYDNGYKDEAIRLAGPLAILLHDNARSQGVSLLKQLDKKDRNFFDTAMPYNPKNQMSHEGLIQMDISADADSTFIAPLDEPINQTCTPFEEWWNAKILVDKEGRELTRKTLVKSIRDQDGGGGHVDPELDNDYAEIAKNYSLGWKISDGTKSEPIPGAEKASIRQITHEVLKTLIPNYSKSRPDTDGTIVGGTQSFKVPEGQDPEEFMNKQQTFTKEEEPGRNDPCPCGSGRKYKHCCL